MTLEDLYTERTRLCREVEEIDLKIEAVKEELVFEGRREFKEVKKLYRPYTMEDDWTKLMDEWIINREGNTYTRIIALEPRSEDELVVRTHYSWYTFQELFDLCVFLDGTPVGVKK
jgi:hypothetical protein